MMTSLLVDGRPIHGDPGLPAATAAFGDLRRHPATLRLLLQESLAYRARMRSIRERLTRRPETFEVKTHAVVPLVNIARWSALAVGSSALPTVERLRAVAASGSAMLPADRADAMVEVFGQLQRLRLRYQLMQRAQGDRPVRPADPRPAVAHRPQPRGRGGPRDRGDPAADDQRRRPTCPPRAGPARREPLSARRHTVAG